MRYHISRKSLMLYIVTVFWTILLCIVAEIGIVATLSILVFITTIYLIATEILMRSSAALFGAVLILIIFFFVGISPIELTHKYVELDTILILFGIIIITSLGLRSGLFYFIGMKVAKASKGDPLLLYFILAIFTYVLSIFLISVATIVVVVTLSLAICDILKIDPRSYILMEIFMVNVSSPATLISSVPNIIIAESVGLSYVFFIENLFPFTIFFFLLSLWMVFAISTPPFVVDMKRAVAILEIDEWLFVKNKLEFYISVFCIGGLIVGFIASREFLIIALIFAVIALAFSSSPEELIKDVDWDTLLFFIGFYIIVASLSITGMLDMIAYALVMLSGGNVFLLLTLLFWVSLIASGFIDNIPYVLVMVPIISVVVSQEPFIRYAMVFWICLILACNVGGGLNPYSAPQNLLGLSLAKKGKYPIATKEFYKISIKWTILGGIVAYFYSLMFTIAPILIEQWGYVNFITVLTLGLLGLTVICIHKAMGIRRFVKGIKYLIEIIAKKMSKERTKVLVNPNILVGSLEREF